MSVQPDATIVRIPGCLQPDEPLWLASQIAPSSSLFADAEPARAFRLGLSGRRGGPADVEKESIPANALVEIEFESGLRFWTSGADLPERLLAVGADVRRGPTATTGGAWDLPVSITPPPAGTRGLAGRLTIKALRWVGLDPVRVGLDKIIELAETRSVPREGLFRVGDDGVFGEPFAEPIPDGARTLILLHGTASSTRGSFSKLWLRQPTQWKRLRERFGERIYALDHCTLTKSPIENALNLARVLPRKGAVSFLSHSRGGLVGELLCLDPAALDRVGIKATLDASKKGDKSENAALEQQQAQFFELVRELEARPELEIERFVRVSCPVIGTSLAGQKLDQWFSLLVLAAIADELRRGSTRGLVAGGLASLAQYGLDVLAEITAAVIGSRKRVDELPGLAAQMPDSALVRILNGNPGRGELFVVAGDAAPSEQDWLAELRFGLIDRYFERDHDLVVDTRAMLDGPARPTRKVFFRSGTTVNHFSYFGNEDSAAASVAALVEAPETHTLFRDYEGEWPLPEAGTRGLFSPRPLADPPLQDARGIVVVVPGLCGSELKVAGGEVWASVLALARGGFRKALRIDNPAVEPGGPLAGTYMPLANALRRNGYVVRMHGYDWRKSIADSTGDLSNRLDEALSDATPGKLPVHVIAHSMGGLLIRATFAEDRALWKRWREQPRSEARVIMLGTPNQGSHSITLMLTRRDDFFGKLALLDLHSSEKDLLRVAQLFPGVLELLPRVKEENGDTVRLAATWEAFLVADRGGGWPAPAEEPLKASAGVWETLLTDDPLLENERLIYVAGTAAQTPNRAEVGKDGKFHLYSTADGDGRVTWASGIPDACRTGKRCYYMNAVHGDMPAHADAHPALLELLQKGDTAHRALPTQPVPVQVRGGLEVARDYARIRATDASHYPTRADLLATATGATLEVARYEPGAEDRAAVQVIHGDLIYVDAPVLVGHVQGVNNLEEAEFVLNWALNGRMQRRLDAGIYAGPLGSHALFPRQPDEQFAVGAIVIGIGRIGELSPGRLAEGVASALVAYAIAQLEEHDRKLCERPDEDERVGKEEHVREDDGEPLELPVCALLIGAAGGDLSLQDSVVAILRGHRNARERLVDAGVDERVSLCALNFVELLEDRAIQALKAVRDAVALDGELRRCFSVADTLTISSGWRWRPYAEPASGNWARITINSVEMADGSGTQLLFDTHGNLARTERLYNGISLDSIKEFTRRMIDTERDDEEVGRAMFEMLLPNWLKDQAPDRRRAQLVLDAAAATIPWELLRDRIADRGDRASAPLSVRSGLVRQLSTGRFRQGIRRADDYHALVVGDPDLGALSQTFRPLLGARTEATEVAHLLEEGGYVAPPPLIGSAAEQIQLALYRQDWRVVHLSGHGVYCETLPEVGKTTSTKRVTGMLIGDGILLTTAHIEQMRVVPDFVFINCCSLGHIEPEPWKPSDSRPGNPMLAANLARQLIEMGVRGVIAAGWKVLDDAALLFARAFYEAFLGGATFGEAVLAARRATYDRYPRSNTWGAYQCYGDPGLLLPRPRSRGGRSARPIHYDFVAPSEVLAELKRLTQLSYYENVASPESRRRRLEAIDALARLCEGRKWLARGDIQEAFGRLWGELGDHLRAIECYRAAMEAEDATSSVKATEQLVNMLSRHASDLFKSEKESKRKEGEEKMSEAKILVDRLIEIAPTAERYSLKGSICRRRLAVTPEDGLDAGLRDMADAYKAAEERAVKAGGRLYYPAINVLHASISLKLLEKLDDDDLAEARNRIQRVKEEIGGPGFQGRNFWDSLAPLDLMLAERMLDAACTSMGTKEYDFEKVKQVYKTAMLSYSSRRERGSMLAPIDSLVTLLERVSHTTSGRNMTVEAILKNLKVLRNDLYGMT